MKRCQECDFQHEALFDNCWQCGSPLIVSANSGYAPQSMQATQAFRSETPTFYQDYRTEFNPQLNTNRFDYAPNNRETPGSNSSRKIILAVAGIFTFFLLFSVVGAATYLKVTRPRPLVKLNEQPVKKTEVVKETETEPVNESEQANTSSTNNSRTTRTSTRRSNTVNTNDRESAELKRMWIDYNVKENGRLGMRIHVSFKVYNMEGVRSYLGLYFAKENGTRLTTKNKKFASTDGQVAVYYFLTPDYDETVYDDVTIFMPYDELNLGRGKFDLTISADVIYEKGGLIEHLKDHDFVYEER